jgi:AcrR family transcriptional regulator
MGHDERRKRDQQILRNRILDAARELFADLGYEAVTMRRIAGKIEYSPTTIYLHFSDKAALMRELCSVDFLSLAACFRTIGAERDALERIKAIGRAYVEFALTHPNHYKLMFMTLHPPVPEEERQIRKGSLDEDAWAVLVAAVTQAQQEGLLRSDAGDASAVAQQLFSGVHGVVALHLVKANDPWIGWTPVREASERMMEALIRGLSISPLPARR